MPRFPFRSSPVVAVAAMAIFLTAPGCVSTLPPRPTPPRALPKVAIDPPPARAGMAQLGVHVTEGRTQVARVVLQSSGYAFGSGGSAASFGESVEPLCTAPCVAELPYGNHKLKLTPSAPGYSAAFVDVTIGEAPTVLDASLGRYESTGIGTIIGASSLLGLGGAGAAVGGIMAAMGDDSAGPVLGLGVAMLVGGILWLVLDPIIVQEPGMTQWQPGDGRVYDRQ